MLKVLLFFFIIFILTSEIFCCYLLPTKSGGTCDELQNFVVDRNGWCATQPSQPMECLWGPVPYVIIHHTVTDACSTEESCADSMRKLQKEHMSEKGWPDVGYHFVIGGDGKAYVGRQWNKMGGHTKNHNRMSIGIALFGDFQKDSPSTEMLDLIPKITYCGVEKGYIHPDFLVIGHRDAYCSSCPGDALYQVIKKWPRFPGVIALPTYTCDTKKKPPPETTTEALTTTVTPTTLPPTTTPEPTTTTTTTVAPTTTTEKVEKIISVYIPVYLLLSKKPVKCCHK